MKESVLERNLCQSVLSIGGECFKWVSPGCRGVPDRIVLYRGGTVFVETKAVRGTVEPWQARIHARLEKQGFPVIVLRDLEHLEDFIAELILWKK